MHTIDKKKILYISTKSVWGGAQKYIVDLIDYLPKDSYQIEVAAGGHGQFARAIEERHIPYHELYGLERDLSPLADIRSFFQIWSLVRRVKPHIVHLNGSKVSVLGALASRLAGIEHIVSSTHGWAFLEERPVWQKRIIAMMTRLGALFQDRIICVSELDYLIGTEWNIAHKSKLVQIHNGVDAKKHLFLERAEARKRLFERHHIPSQDYVIVGTIAEYTKNKGLHYLIEAARHIVDIKPNVLFFLMGWGEEKEYFKERIATYRLENHVILVDSLPEAFTYLKALDIFILPSVKEGFAYVLLEASLAELPLIATNVGGNPEIVSNLENGLLIQPRSPHDIINAIFHLIRDDKERNILGEAARKKVVENFSITSMVELTLRTYEIKSA